MKYFFPVQYFELREPVRFSKYSGIYQIAYQIRDTLTSGNQSNINIEENGNVTLYDSVDEIINHHVDILKNKPTLPTTMIAYTNNVVSTLNKNSF